MSRSGYTEDDLGNWAMIKWRGMVASATRGKRGQKLFRDLLAALDAMPTKRLITRLEWRWYSKHWLTTHGKVTEKIREKSWALTNGGG